MCQGCAREKRRATPKTIPRKALNWGALARFGCAQERVIDKPELLASGITNHAAGAVAAKDTAKAIAAFCERYLRYCAGNKPFQLQPGGSSASPARISAITPSRSSSIRLMNASGAAVFGSCLAPQLIRSISTGTRSKPLGVSS